MRTHLGVDQKLQSSNPERREDYVGQGINLKIVPKTAGSRSWSSSIFMIFIIYFLVNDQKIDLSIYLI
jgi:hypothetical protein